MVIKLKFPYISCAKLINIQTTNSTSYSFVCFFYLHAKKFHNASEISKKPAHDNKTVKFPFVSRTKSINIQIKVNFLFFRLFLYLHTKEFHNDFSDE